ncbi:MAG: sulfite exporter TauE/SafE family protein, partial [Micromonosporaceae bacterium]
GRLEPRRVVGSVDASEFLVAIAASAGFLIALGASAVQWPVVAALLAGGLVAAPIAAWLVRIVPGVMLGAMVGGVILLTNARTVLDAVGFGGGSQTVAYGVIAAAWALALAMSVRIVLRDRRAAATATEPALEPA